MAKRSSGPIGTSGPIVIIGGHEAKEGNRQILAELVKRADSGTLLVMTLASEEALAQWKQYQRVFTELGAKKVEHFDIENRADAHDERLVRLIERTAVFFFTGGDQLRITSKFGGSVYCEMLRKRHAAGATAAGTSAGASVMSETMLVSGPGDNSHRVGDNLRMAPGLGLVQGIIVDQHFAERGRLGRLVGAMAQNPRLLGVGIDENTAIILEHQKFRVIGEGAVYVLDGSQLKYTNVSEAKPDVTLAAHNIKLDLLSNGDTYDLKERVASCRETAKTAAGSADAEA